MPAEFYNDAPGLQTDPRLTYTLKEAGDYLITGPNWKGQIPSGIKQISSPNNSVLTLGRVFVENERDVPTAYGLAKQIQLTPLSRWHPGQ